MFSADSVHNAFMKSSNRERAAFQKAAAGDISYRTAEFCLRTQGMECNCIRCAHDTTMVYGRPATPGGGPVGRFTPRPKPKDDIGSMDATEKLESNNSASRYENRVLPNVSTRF